MRVALSKTSLEAEPSPALPPAPVVASSYSLPKKLCVVVLVLLGVIGAVNSGWQLSQTAQKQDAAFYSPPPAEPLPQGSFTLPSSFIQRIAVLRPLKGLRIRVQCEPGPCKIGELGDLRLVLRSSDEQILADAHLRVEGGDATHATAYFSTVSPSPDMKHFSVEGELPADTRVSLLLSAVEVFPNLLVKGEQSPHSLLFTPVYDVPKLMRWRALVQSQSYLFCAMLLLGIVTFWKRSPHFVCTAGFALLLTYCSLVRFPFSPVDEAEHFGYVAHVMENGSIPLTSAMMPLDAHEELRKMVGQVDFMPPFPLPFYEAVQPPLYYGLASVVGNLVLRVTHEWAAVFYAVRLFGVMLVTAGFYFVARSHASLRRTGLLPAGSFEGAVALGVTMASPCALSILSTITNDQLAFTLGSAVYALLVHAACHGGFTTRRVVGLAGLCGVLWLTKLTGAFLSVICLIYLLAARQWRRAGLFVAIVATCVAPLHLFYWKQYASFTAIGGQMSFVKTMVNPDDKALSIVQTVWLAIVDQFGRMHSSESFFLSDWQTNLCYVTVAAPLTGLLYAIGRSTQQVTIEPRQVFRLGANSSFLNGLLVMGCLAPFVMCCLGTYLTHVVVTPPRFAFPSLFCYATLISVAATLFSARWQRAGLSAVGITMLLITVSYVGQIRAY